MLPSWESKRRPPEAGHIFARQTETILRNPHSMLLAVDIGNTHTGLGVFQHDRLIATHRLSTSRSRTPAETWAAISPFLSGAGISAQTLTGFGISSVVPEVAGTFE